MTIYLFFHLSDEDESDTTTHEAVFSQRCIESYFRMNSMACLKKFDVPVNFANLAAANKVPKPRPCQISAESWNIRPYALISDNEFNFYQSQNCRQFKIG